MKKLNQLWILEADNCLEPLYPQHERLLSSGSHLPVAVYGFDNLTRISLQASPELVLFHSNLTTITHLRQFVAVKSLLPSASLVIVSEAQDEELCLLALEAGAEDSILQPQLTPAFLKKHILLSLRRHQIEMELRQSREQLLACIETTPNVAVQWYNSKSEVLYWNKASERIFGWTAEEAVGRTIDELIAIPENRSYWRNKICHLAEGSAPYGPEEWNFRYRDGREGCCISTLVPLPSFNRERLFVCMDIEITDRKQMEKALRESEDRYHALFAHASDAIFIYDTEGQFLEMNDKAVELAGYTRGQLLQMKVSDLFKAQELARRPLMWVELLRGERTRTERTMQHAGGERIPIEITANMFEPGRIMAIVRDVSARKKAERAMQQSEEKYRSLIEQQADAIAIFDQQGRILDVNTSASVQLQYGKEELQRMRLSDIIVKEELETQPVDFRTLKRGQSTIKQRRMRRKDGSVMETEVHAKRLFDDLFLASVRDLSERMEVQRQLKKESELSDSIINSLPGLFYFFQPGVGYLRWNRQLEEISGYSAGELRQMTPLDFFDDDEKDGVAAAVQEVFEKGENAVEANLLTKGGEKIPFYFTGRYHEYNGKPAFLGTGIDLSEVKKLEDRLSQQRVHEQKRIIQAMIEAEENEKNKLGLELHDNVNQILSVVRMYISILASGDAIEEVTLEKTLKLLDNAIQEIRHLSHSLAIGYKFETGLKGTLEDLVEKLRLSRDFDVRLHLSPHLDCLTSTQQKLAVYRIVQEQLNNVVKHAGASEVDISIDMGPNELRLSIADNGKGFDPATAKKGLGLSTMTNRAEALGGKAALQSAPGQGCRLSVSIPLKP